jgi:hypothetical protein
MEGHYDQDLQRYEKARERDRQIDKLIIDQAMEGHYDMIKTFKGMLREETHS